MNEKRKNNAPNDLAFPANMADIFDSQNAIEAFL